jgi:hypothetical protein
MLVRKNRGDPYLEDRHVKTELALIDRELKRLKARIVQLEMRKSKLIASPGRQRAPARMSRRKGAR